MKIKKFAVRLLGGCVFTIGVAGIWMGAGDIIAINNDVDTMINIINEQHNNAIEINNKYEEQKKIYIEDSKSYRELIDKANEQLNKANDELDKANSQVKELRIHIDSLTENAKAIPTIPVTNPVECYNVNESDLENPDGHVQEIEVDDETQTPTPELKPSPEENQVDQNKVSVMNGDNNSSIIIRNNNSCICEITYHYTDDEGDKTTTVQMNANEEKVIEIHCTNLYLVSVK